MPRPRQRPLPTVDELHRRFTYEPDTGIIRAKWREETDRYTVAFNRRYANKPAGGLMNQGYCWIRVGEQCLLGHRIAWALHFGEWPDGEIDHRDGDKTNNALTNLRIATRGQNIISRKLRGESRFKGVSRSGKKWRTYIRVGGRAVYLGTFEREEEAAEAYLRAALEVHGDFAFVPRGRVRGTVIISMAA